LSQSFERDNFRSNKYGVSYETMLSSSYFYSHTKEFYEFYWDTMVNKEAKPNKAHYALSRFEEENPDKKLSIVTQNIDGLHKAAGNIRVYELHGNIHENSCLECNASWPMEKILHSEGIPRCDCGGVIKPNVVLYGEPLEKYVCIGARREITNADTLIVAGTSLAVEPAASFIDDFRGKHLIVINRDPTPADEKAELLLREDVAEVFRHLMDMMLPAS
jgi:NAD-dependent deacetylase